MPIDFSVSKGAKEQLELGLRWHEEGHSGDGLLPSTVAEARRLVTSGKWWPSKVKRAYSFFSRHGAQAGPMRDDKGRPTPKAVAWALWGGDDGFANVKRIRESMLAEERGLAAERRGCTDDETTGQPDGALGDTANGRLVAHMHYLSLTDPEYIPEEPQMKNTPEAQHAYREAIAHAMEHADMHARMLAGGHVGDEHREMHVAHACRSLDMADDLHRVMCDSIGDGLKRDEEGEEFAVPGGIENSALAQRFSEVAAKVGKLPRSLRAVARQELGRVDADLLEEKLMGAKTDRAALLALKQQAVESAKVVDRAETERAIEAALDERLITPADAARMRGIDPATKTAAASPWQRSRVERFISERREGGPVAPIPRPGAERTVPVADQTARPQVGGSVPIRFSEQRGATLAEATRLANDVAAKLGLDPQKMQARMAASLNG
jgi:hypothetical protein